VVDDLLAITIIAVFYTSSLSLAPLLLALVPLGLFALLVQKRRRSWYLLIPLAVATWALVHASGIHATVAGVLLAVTVPVRRSEKHGGPSAGPGMAERFEHRYAAALRWLRRAGVRVLLGGRDDRGSARSQRIAE